MNLTNISITIGTFSFLAFYIVLFILAINKKRFRKSGQIGLLWASIFIFFLFLLRIGFLLHLASQEQLRIISGFSATVPLIYILLHLFFAKEIEDGI